MTAIVLAASAPARAQAPSAPEPGDPASAKPGLLGRSASTSG